MHAACIRQGNGILSHHHVAGMIIARFSVVISAVAKRLRVASTPPAYLIRHLQLYGNMAGKEIPVDDETSSQAAM